jgi:hypothetical protein
LAGKYGKLTLTGGGEEGVDGEEDLLVVDVEVDQVPGDPVYTATPRSSLHFLQPDYQCFESSGSALIWLSLIRISISDTDPD